MVAKLYKERAPAVHAGNPTAGFRNLMDWLTGADRGELLSGTTTGPTGVKVVEAYDGVIRETGTAGLDTLGATNLWRTGQLTATSGPWIVIEFPGTGANPFQILFRVHSANYRISTQLIPNADFATGGAAVAAPTLPATTIPAVADNTQDYPGPSPLAFTTFYAFCDPGVFIFMGDTGSEGTAQMYYVGEVDEADAADTKPFVIFRSVDDYLEPEWGRLSPVDGTTELPNNESENWTITQQDSSFIWGSSDLYTDLDGDWLRSPVFPAWRTVSHQHIAGRCRYLELSNTNRALRSTSADRSRIVFNGASARRGAVNLPWDSLTPFPG